MCCIEKYRRAKGGYKLETDWVLDLVKVTCLQRKW